MNKKPFDWKYFNDFKSHATQRAVARAGMRNRSLYRSVDAAPPLRAPFEKYRRNGKVTLRGVSEMTQLIITLTEKVELSDEGRTIIRDFETFQVDQKGPVAPVSETAWTDQVETPFLSDTENAITIERCRDLLQDFESLYSHFNLEQANFDATKINFKEQGLRLPSSTTRGFPYNAPGKLVDDAIISEAGSSFDDALKYFQSSPQQTSFTGVRLQGTPSFKEAKVRMISIAETRYQGINNGLVYYISLYLKTFPNFAAGLTPDERDQMIVSIIENAEKNNCTMIPMDFSKFDRSCNRELRKMAYEPIRLYFRNTPGINDYFKQQLNYSDNQFIIFNINNRMRPTRVDNLLMSGVADTQLTGSLINLAIQSAIQRQLGSPVLGDSMLALGDDVGLPISNTLLERGGYKGLLAKIAEIVEPYGFHINVEKAYPTPVLVFLQRLYSPKHGIIGYGSYVRTFNSGIYMERYPEIPEGIKSLKALQIFAGIAMWSDVERGPVILMKEFRNRLAHFWLERDEALRAVIAAIYDSASDEVSNADAMVRVIINLSTSDLDDLLTYFGAHAYDRFNLASDLSRPNYGLVFNFGVELIRAWGQISYSAGSIREEFGFDVNGEDTLDSDDDFVRA